MTRSVLLAVVLTLSGTTEARAQLPADSVTIGDRVRVRSSDVVYVGALHGLDHSALTILTPDTVRLRLEAIQRLERSTGKRVLTGALGGALIGGALGGAAAYFVDRRIGDFMVERAPAAGSSGTIPGFDASHSATLSGVGVGAFVGLLVGALAAPEGWRRVAIPQRLDTLPRSDPQSGGGLFLQWSF